MANLRFGTGGFPLTTKPRNVLNGIKRVRELGLDAMELEFVYSNFVKKEDAGEVRSVAKELDITLTVHGSYFVNLASPEENKLEASIERIIKSAKIGDLCGAKSITFHPAAYMGRKHPEVHEMVIKAFSEIFSRYGKENLKIRISPELTGKAAQYGDLGSLIEIIKEFKGENIGLCFDFAHKHARNGGGWNSYEEFVEMLDLIESNLGKKFLEDMHIHMSGINYSPKGERNHLTFLSSQEEYRKMGIDVGDLSEHYKELEKKTRLDIPDINWKELLKALKFKGVGGVLICESPNLEEDALLMKNYYESL